MQEASMTHDIDMWYTYMVKCNDDTIYTGITKDLDRRTREHNTSPRGAKYTRSRRPVTLVYQRQFNTRSDAQKFEYRIKKMTRKQKLALTVKSHELG